MNDATRWTPNGGKRPLYPSEYARMYGTPPRRTRRMVWAFALLAVVMGLGVVL